MENNTIEDFNNLSFEEWLNFVFDEKWSDDNNEEYVELDDFEADIELFVKNCVKLFENPSFLLEKFNENELESGFFHFILSPRSDIWLWLWDKNNSEELRRQFIFSSINIFKEIFTKNPLTHSCFMWWDSLRNFNEDKDLKVEDWMFQIISKILEINSIDCQLSALHGLGHIENRGKKEVIKSFLKKHPKFPDKEYALAAIKGKVL